MNNKKGSLNIKDIAKIAKTSTATISYFLNGKKEKMSSKTWEKISSIVKEFNYSPTDVARQLRTKKSNVVAIIVGNIAQRFSNQLYQSISDNIIENNFILSLFSSKLNTESEIKIIESLLRQNVAYIVIQASKKFESEFEKISSQFSDSHSKIIIVDSYKENSKFKHVYHDSFSSVDNFIKAYKNDFNNIVYTTESTKFLDVRSRRVDIFKEIAKKHNLFFKKIQFEKNEFNEKKFTDKIKDLSFKDTLFCCNNSEITKRALIVLKKIFSSDNEEEFKLLSYNKCSFAKLSRAKISIIDTKTWKIGKVITNIINGDIKEKNVKIETKLLVNDSDI